MNELISVIVPVYQGEKTIKKCIESILGSSYPNMEVVVVNDSSTDNTAQVVEEMRKNDSRILLVNNTGKGVSSARNTGLRNAHGAFIGFVDADDAVDVKMYETLKDKMADGYDMVFCGTMHCKKQGEKPEEEQKALVGYERKCPIEALETVIYEKTTMSVCSKLFKRDLIRNSQNEVDIQFPEDQERYEDFMFVCRYVAKSTGKICFVPQYFYCYTTTEGSLSHKQLPATVIRKSLAPLLELGESMGGTVSELSKVFYTETMVKQWYISRIKKTSRIDHVEFDLLKQEAKRYEKQYLNCGKVAVVRRMAAGVLFCCEPVAKVVVFLFGKFVNI